MDLFETGVDMIEDITSAAEATATPYSFAGVGAGPIASPVSAARLATTLAPAQNVLVRDGLSRDLCVEALGRTDTRCAPDLAFALRACAGQAHRSTLAVNVAAVGSTTWPVRDAEGYRLYLDGMTRLVLEAAAKTRPDCIEIVTTNPAVDNDAGRDLAARLADRAAIPVRQPVLRDVTDILEAFGRAKLAIITRLHAGIMAALAGAPVLPVAYQPKVVAVLSETGIASQAISLTDLQSLEFNTATALAQAIEHGSGLRPETRELALSSISDLLPGVDRVQA
jgi:polysaccharide pyruvyl transferase WcaK-like protein